MRAELVFHCLVPHVMDAELSDEQVNLFRNLVPVDSFQSPEHLFANAHLCDSQTFSKASGSGGDLKYTWTRHFARVLAKYF